MATDSRSAPSAGGVPAESPRGEMLLTTGVFLLVVSALLLVLITDGVFGVEHATTLPGQMEPSPGLLLAWLATGVLACWGMIAVSIGLFTWYDDQNSVPTPLR